MTAEFVLSELQSVGSPEKAAMIKSMTGMVS